MTRFPFPLEELDTPAILIELPILDTNLRRMQSLANTHGIALRPHIKTHKSAALAERQRALGARGIATAKLSEAEVMVSAGFHDIQIANQIVGKTKIGRMADLAARSKISCSVDSTENVREINEIFRLRGISANLFIEIDTGLGRAGLRDNAEILELAQLLESLNHTRFAGLLTHAGHAYRASSQAELASIGKTEANVLVELSNMLAEQGIETPTISVGSTPTARWAAEVPGVTELRVGNYIFNDAMQVALGVAGWEDCALSILATVTSSHAERCVLDAGSKVLSSDAGAHGTNRLFGFGHIIGMSNAVERLSEEHAVVLMRDREGRKVGDRVRVIPNHACPVMNLTSIAWLVQGEEVVGQINVDARGMSC